MFDSDNSDIRLQVYPLQKDGQFTQEEFRNGYAMEILDGRWDI